MTTNETPTETPEEATDHSEGMAPKPLREAYNRTKEENRKLKAEVMLGEYEKAGLDPTTGLGKAIAKEYDGEADVDQLLAFAKEEYGYEQPSSDETPEHQERQGEQQKLEGVEANSTQPVPLTESQALQEASKNRDLVTAGNIKAAKVRALMKP